jgi:ATP-dependent protease HslVU (ClpYQ) peptidase subunit
MNRRLAVLAGAVLLASGWVSAQDVGLQEDLRFVNELRKRNSSDLALDFLKQMRKNAPPALQKELDLEIAKTELEATADEPDSGKRLAAYGRIQEALKKFLAENKGHPRSGEVTLDLAQVAVQRGRTQLSRALLQDTPEGRAAEGAKARELLVAAGVELKKAADVLDQQIAAAPSTTPQEQAAKKNLETQRLRAELNIGLNLFDQAMSFSKTAAENEVLLERAKWVQKAQDVLLKLQSKDDTNPICWIARAWVGRCYDELGLPKKARESFTQILDGPPRIAADGQRLARYFRLLVIKDSPEPKEKPLDIIIEAGSRWIADYRPYLKTPEGYGMRFLLAEALAGRAEERKIPAEKAADLAQARKLLADVEATENDFSDRAKRLKIQIIGKQGGFTRPVAELKSFEDCYVRAQYEIMQLGEDPKKIKDPGDLEKARKAHIAALLGALDRGLQTPEAKKASLEVNNARAMYAFWALNEGKYKDAIRVGEGFARNDPRSAQAALAAMYALQAYVQMLADPERATPEDLKDAKERMLALAQYMEERWPKEPAGDMARHQIGLKLLREVKYPEAIAKLEAIAPSYPAYALVQFQLAEAAFSADKDKAKPIPGDKLGYHQRALAALERVPEPAAGADPYTNRVYLQAKIRLAFAMFKAKKFDEMQKMAEALAAKEPGLRCDADDKLNERVHNQFAFEIQDALLYAKYGQADAAFAAGNFKKVAALLDPMVKEVNEGKLPHFQKKPELGMALLSMALKADVQVGQLDKTREVLKALQTLSAQAGAEAGASSILQQLAALIEKQVEELRKKNQEADLKKAVASYSAILDDIVKQNKNPTPKVLVQLARCYSNMEEHQKAVDTLDKIARPEAGSPDAKLYPAVQLMKVRELRLCRKLEEAHKILDEEILKTWGKRDIGAQKEAIFLLEEDGKYAEAALRANALVKQLLPKISEDNNKKENYLELYYHVAYCFLKHGQGLDDAAKKEKMLKEAAHQIVELEKKQDGFGSEASRKRFEDLLDKEPQLKERYEQEKTGGK